MTLVLAGETNNYPIVYHFGSPSQVSHFNINLQGGTKTGRKKFWQERKNIPRSDIGFTSEMLATYLSYTF